MLRFFQLYAIVTYLQAAVRDRPQLADSRTKDQAHQSLWKDVGGTAHGQMIEQYVEAANEVSAPLPQPFHASSRDARLNWGSSE